MSPRFVRTQFIRLLTIAVVVSVAACGSDDVGAAKLKELKNGDNRARIAEVVGQGPLTATNAVDSLRVAFGYRIQRYMSNGATHEILWYRESPGTLEDSLSTTANTPLVISGDTLVGWGWDFYDKYAATHNLPNPSKDAARLDSISKSQQPRAPKP